MTSSEQIRAWSGPALLSYGFRPFFLFGAIWAAASMIMWISMLSGGPFLPTQFDPVSWHAHEFLFGYLGAIVAGFLLTAVPNWTGRLPVVGWKLGALVGVWGLGRIAVATSEYLSPALVALTDLAFLLALGGVILREIVAGKNWKNLIVLAMLVVLTIANGIFHLEAARGDYAAQGIGLRLGLAAALMMVSVIGGRVVPSFTRNWLVKVGSDIRPAPPMQRFDKITLLSTLAALAVWVTWPEASMTGLLVLLMGVLQTARLIRWKGQHTTAQPLVWVLHAGYSFVPLGALIAGGSIFFPELIGSTSAQHVWMAGAIGLMTLAVMTRATLGHSGRELHANAATTAIYLIFIVAVFARLMAGLFPDALMTLYSISAICWIASFGGFAALYGPMLLLPKPEKS